jgi:predicted AlkP superfamily phosphohydrolase/phosphomutase
VYLGLDACDVRVATDLMAQGELPTLRRLLDDGASVETESPAGVFVTAQWATMFTGRDPARHGYLCWKHFTPGTYTDLETSPQMIDGRPFWEALSDAGRRVAIVDVPHTSAPEQLNGTMLVEWGCHDRHFGTHSLPATLVDELNQRFGRHPIGTHRPPRPGFDQFAPCDYSHRAGRHRTTEENAALWNDIVEGHARKRAASLHLLDQEPWDLFVSVFGEGHCTGHQLWAVHDETHPWHEAEARERIGGDPLVEIYRRLDDTVAEHLARLGPETTVYVNLSHGMGPHYDGTHLLDDVLRRLAAGDRGGWRTSVRGLASGAFGVAQRHGGAAARSCVL